MTSLFYKNADILGEHARTRPQVIGSRAGKMTMLLNIAFRVSRKGPRNRRSLGFARDDKGKGNGS
jgi:hypothetical protein